MKSPTRISALPSGRVSLRVSGPLAPADAILAAWKLALVALHAQGRISRAELERLTPLSREGLLLSPPLDAGALLPTPARLWQHAG